MSFARPFALVLGALLSGVPYIACTGDDPNLAGTGKNDPDATDGQSVASGSFALHAPGPAILAPNETVKVAVEIDRKDGFTGAVKLIVQPLADGIAVAPLTLSGTETKGELSITANSSAQPTVTRLQVVATADPALSDTKDLPFVLRGPAGTHETTYGDKDGVTILQDLVPFGYANTSDDGVVIASQSSVVRVNADGKRDTAFGTGGKTDLKQPADRTVTLRIAKDGKIYVFTYKEDRTFLAVHRLLANGTYDTAYGTDGVASYPLEKPANQPYVFGSDVDEQGRAVVGLVPGTDGTSVFVRFLADGKQDTDFAAKNLKTTSGSWNDLRVRGETAIVFGAGFNNPQTMHSTFALSLVTSSTPAAIALPGGEFTAPTVGSVTFDSKGRMLIAGDGANSDDGTGQPNGYGVLVRANADGTPDTTLDGSGAVYSDLGSQSGTYAQFSVALEDAPGKILVVGTRVPVSDGVRKQALLRYDDQGRLDPTFGNGGVVLEDVPSANSSKGAYLQGIPTFVVLRSYDPGSTMLTRYWR
jgi:uncharacterized delta-60 repeat protein